MAPTKTKKRNFTERMVSSGMLRRNVPEDTIFHSHRRENLKPYTKFHCIYFDTNRRRIGFKLRWLIPGETEPGSHCRRSWRDFRVWKRRRRELSPTLGRNWPSSSSTDGAMPKLHYPPTNLVYL
jgi:hypothetical protein